MELGESTVRQRIGNTGTRSQRTRVRLPDSRVQVSVIFRALRGRVNTCRVALQATRYFGPWSMPSSIATPLVIRGRWPSEAASQSTASASCSRVEQNSTALPGPAYPSVSKSPWSSASRWGSDA
jgi:hypothetical protein